MEIITKSEAARRWGIKPAAVHKYRRRGLPERADGKLNWPEVDEWRRSVNTPSLSGSYISRVRAGLVPAAATEPQKFDQRSATAVLDLIRQRSRIGELLASLGASDIVVEAAADFLDIVLYQVDDVVPDYEWPRLPTAKPAQFEEVDVILDHAEAFYASRKDGEKDE